MDPGAAGEGFPAVQLSAPEFVFEHGYQTFLPSHSSESQTAGTLPIPTKCLSRKVTSSLGPRKQSCHYEGCPFKTAYGMKDMERHLRTHTGDKPHKCELCEKCFSRKDKLKTHVRSHTGEKPYKCKECDYTAADSSSMCKHQRIHTNERPFKCQICPYASRNSSQLTVHLRSHTVSAPEFVFEHGYQTFLPSHSSESQTAGTLPIPTKCQSRKVTSSLGPRKQSCHYEGCPFKTAYGMKDMERHLRTHTGDKPHKCELCEKCFSRKDKLKTHVRSHTGEKPYKCKECDYTAADSSSMCKHQRIHTNERPFKCQICPYASRNSSQLTVHLRSHTVCVLGPGGAGPERVNYSDQVTWSSDPLGRSHA